MRKANSTVIQGSDSLPVSSGGGNRRQLGIALDVDFVVSNVPSGSAALGGPGHASNVIRMAGSTSSGTSEEITKSSLPFTSRRPGGGRHMFRSNAIHRPSGDQEGLPPELPALVSLCGGLLPLALITQ